MENLLKWTIYCHKNKINGKMYIGQTNERNIQSRWRKNGLGYKPKKDHTSKFYNAIIKYGWDNFEHIILEDGIETLEKANEREKFWISYYDTFNNDDKGYNMTSGGDNFVLSDEARKKQTKSLKQFYKNNPEMIFHQRDIQTKISGKAVYCFEKDKIYQSLAEAARDNNIDISAITRCLTRKNQITTNGLHWKYVNENITLEEIENSRKKSKKKVLCEETGIIYNSPKEAAEILNIDNNAIAKCCRGIKKTYYNYHWRYVDE